MEIWTGGDIPATIHQVVVPEAELQRQKARQSIAYFIHPDFHVNVEPLIPVKSNKTYPVINARQHLLNMYSQTH